MWRLAVKTVLCQEFPSNFQDTIIQMGIETAAKARPGDVACIAAEDEWELNGQGNIQLTVGGGIILSGILFAPMLVNGGRQPLR
jgi:hypothetical protein